MVWIKQYGGVGCRWVCSHCGTLLVRAVDKEPLPSRCDACGEFATDAVDAVPTEGTPSVTACAVPPPSVREALEAGVGGAVYGEESAGADDAECP